MAKDTVITFRQAKQEGRKLSMLTCYDYTTAKIMDRCVDAILVGDSLGTVVLGYPTTCPVTMEDMIRHAGAVVRGAANTLVVVDMPFMSYQASVRDAVLNAGRLIAETGATAVKLEGGVDVVPQIEAIVKAGIPVMGHVGLTPQASNALGGFKVQGKTPEAVQKLIDDAKAVEAAGAFSIVIECVPSSVGTRVTQAVNVPTIGIGAGVECDGQVLVYTDMLAMGDFTPKFVKHFGDAGTLMREAFQAYTQEVRDGAYPTEQYGYKG